MIHPTRFKCFVYLFVFSIFIVPHAFANSAPSVAITSPVYGTNHRSGSNSIAITANATDSDGRVVRVEFWKDNKPVFVDTQAPYSFTMNGVEDGMHYIDVYAYDEDGGVHNEGFPIFVNRAELADEFVTFWNRYDGRDEYSQHLHRMVEYNIMAQDTLETSRDYAKVRRIVDDIFKRYPPGDWRWWAANNESRRDGRRYFNVGNMPGWYSFWMLDEIAKVGVSGVAPSVAEELKLLVVISKCGEGNRPTNAEFTEFEYVDNLTINPDILANDYEHIRESIVLFQEFVWAITDGKLRLKLEFYETDRCATLLTQTEPKILRADSQDVLRNIPESLRDTADMFMVISPTSRPKAPIFGQVAVISGGMGLFDGAPIFITDDAFPIYTLPPSYDGTRAEDIGIRAYMPQWYFHEFAHHLFRSWREYKLEEKGHQWFDRNTWPADFVGNTEPEYYMEAINKRLRSASPSISEKLKVARHWNNSTSISKNDLVGNYQTASPQNAWHTMNITNAGGQLWWNNSAGVSWRIEYVDGFVRNLDGPYPGQAYPVELRTLPNGDSVVATVGTFINLDNAIEYELSGKPLRSVGVGDLYTFLPVLSESFTNPTFSIRNKPSWANFNTSTGLLTGTPGPSDVGTVSNIIITANQGGNSASLPNFNITVPAPPAVSTSVDFVTNVKGSTILDNDTIAYMVTFSDAMNASSVNLSDFENGGTATVDIANLAATQSPNVYSLSVSPRTGGTIRLRIKSGATLTSTRGARLNTNSAISDSRTYTVVLSDTSAPNPNPMRWASQPKVIPGSGEGLLSSGTLSGNNPSTGTRWKDGDFYRLAFLTSTKRNAASHNIEDYNAFVQSVADSSPLGLGAASWKVIGSTNSVNARDNTSTNPDTDGVGVPVYLANGSTLVATGNADLWDGNISNAINVDEKGNGGWNVSVATGSGNSGIKSNRYLGGSNENPAKIDHGRSSSASGHWIIVFNGGASSDYHYYALSEPITVGYAVTMTAATASDASGVEYYFTETTGNPGGDDSGWQSSPTYVDAGLVQGMTYRYTVKARDKSLSQNTTANSSAASVTVGEGSGSNSAPSISGNPAKSVNENQAYSFTPSVFDSDSGDVHSFSIRNKPSWASFNTSTGRLSGTPGYNDAGITSNIIISVSDGTTSDSLPAFNLTVNNINREPSISGSPSTLLTAGQSYAFQPAASDPDTEDRLRFSIQNKPNWASFNSSTGRLSGTPSEGNVGTYNNIVISVSDGKASVLLPAFSITVKTAGNTGDTWTPADTTTQLWYDASDVSSITRNGNLVTRWSDKSGNNLHLVQSNASSQPESGTQTIAGRNAIDFTGDEMHTQSNPFGAAVNNGFVFMVSRTDSHSHGSIFSLSGSHSARWNAHAPWSNNNVYFDTGGYSGNLRIAKGPWANVGEAWLGGFYGSTSDNVQQIYRNGSLFVSDTSGHSVGVVSNVYIGSDTRHRQDITIGEVVVINGTVSADIRQRIEGYLAHKWGLAGKLPSSHPYKNSAPGGGGGGGNNEPSISGNPSRSVTAGQPYSFQPSATDLDAGDTLTFSIQNKPAWASFNSSTGRLSGRPSESNVGVYNNIVISVSDGKASDSLSTFSITVKTGNTGGSWTPADTTTQLWLDASDSSSIARSGNYVTSWSDKSGKGRHVSQSNNTFQSRSGVKTINGLNVIDFDGNDYLQSSQVASWLNGKAYAVFAVHQSDTTNTFDYIVGTNRSAGGKGLHVGFRGTGSWTDAHYGNDQNFSVLRNTNAVMSSTLFLNTGSAFYENGQSKGSGSRPNSALNTDGVLNVGTGYRINGDQFDGGIAEIVIVTDGVNNETRQRIEGYLAHKWGLAGKLPSNHPYKNSAPGGGGGSAPTISGTPATSVDENQAYSFQPTATGSGLSFSIQNKPNWASFNTGTGRLSGTPGFTSAGTYNNIMIRVSNSQSSASLPAFSLTVNNTNRAPSLSGNPPTSVRAGQAYNFTPTLNDPDTDDTHTFGIVNKPSWASFDENTGRVYGTPGASDVGVHADVTIWVSDGNGGGFSFPPVLPAFSITVESGNTGGTWTPADTTTQLWYDASDAGSITRNGNLVTRWSDKSGNGLHLVQSNSSLQPASGTKTIAGRNAIDFTGDEMHTQSNPFGNAVNNAFVFIVGRTDSHNHGSLFSMTGSPSGRWNAHAPWSNNNVYFDTGGYNNGRRVSKGPWANVGETWLGGFYGSTTANVQQIYRNGSLFVGDATGHSVSTVSNVFIGSDASNRQDVTIGEVVIINGTVSADIRQRIEGYLAHKWGLAGKLPSNHPYKNSAPGGNTQPVEDLLLGDYERLPVENAWHVMEITKVDGQLWWSNTADRSWRVSYADGYLTNLDGPYTDMRNKVEFGTASDGRPIVLKVGPFTKIGNAQVEALLGDYTRFPVQNAWHNMEITNVDGQLWWSNTANVSWRVSYADGYLTNIDGPYTNARNLVEFGTAADGSPIVLKVGPFTKTDNAQVEPGPSLPFDNWSGTFGVSSDPLLDDDNGGLSNGLEWVLGSDPSNGDDDGLVAPIAEMRPGEFIYSYRRSDAAYGDANTSISVEFSHDLVTWHTATHVGDGIDEMTIVEEDDFYGSGVDRVTVYLPFDGHCYVRLKLVLE